MWLNKKCSFRSISGKTGLKRSSLLLEFESLPFAKNIITLAIQWSMMWLWQHGKLHSPLAMLRIFCLHFALHHTSASPRANFCLPGKTLALCCTWIEQKRKTEGELRCADFHFDFALNDPFEVFSKRVSSEEDYYSVCEYAVGKKKEFYFYYLSLLSELKSADVGKAEAIRVASLCLRVVDIFLFAFVLLRLINVWRRFILTAWSTDVKHCPFKKP